MNRPILAMLVMVVTLSAACAANREPRADGAEGKESSAGDERTHHRYQDLKSDPNWDSAESANEQLEGD